MLDIFYQHLEDANTGWLLRGLCSAGGAKSVSECPRESPVHELVPQNLMLVRLGSWAGLAHNGAVCSSKAGYPCLSDAQKLRGRRVLVRAEGSIKPEVLTLALSLFSASLASWLSGSLHSRKARQGTGRRHSVTDSSVARYVHLIDSFPWKAAQRMLRWQCFPTCMPGCTSSQIPGKKESVGGAPSLPANGSLSDFDSALASWAQGCRPWERGLNQFVGRWHF